MLVHHVLVVCPFPCFRQGRAVGYGINPRGEAASPLERREFPEGFQKHILGQFLGILAIAYDADDEAEHLLAVVPEEVFIQGGLAVQDAPDDLCFVCGYHVLSVIY